MNKYGDIGSAKVVGQALNLSDKLFLAFRIWISIFLEIASLEMVSG